MSSGGESMQEEKVEFKRLKKAAKTDYCAKVNLAVAYYLGTYEEKPNVGRGVKLLEQAVSGKYAKLYGSSDNTSAEHGAYCTANCYLGYYYATQRSPKPSRKNVSTALRYYNTAAKAGDGLANYSLAMIYKNGLGKIDPDHEKSQQYLSDASERGHANAVYNDELLKQRQYKRVWLHADKASEKDAALQVLAQVRRNILDTAQSGCKEAELAAGLAYLLGDGVDRSTVRAEEYLTSSHEKGCAMATYALGYMYADGIGVPRSGGKAFDYFKESYLAEPSEQNVIALGLCHLMGFGTVRSAEQAYQCFRVGVEQFHSAAAHYQCGMCLTMDKALVEREASGAEPKTAEWYFTNAANTGYAPAMYQLGRLNDPTIGGSRKGEKAFQYYSQAYKKGYKPAAAGLARLFLSGNGVAPEGKRGYVLLKEAEEANVGEAMTMLAQMYCGTFAKGLVDVDYEWAGQYWLKGANCGELVAMREVAQAYREGKYGIPKDPIKALEWRERCANMGDVDDYRALATAYDKGDRENGVGSNSEKAAYWYAMAALYSPVKKDREYCANQLNRYARDLNNVWGTKREVKRRIKKQRAQQRAEQAAQKKKAKADKK